MTRQITLEEVKKHKRKSSVWMIIHNDVYDVTSFLQEHPGGEESLVAFAGKDGTQVFEDVNHSEDARELMKKYKIGSLPPEQQHTHIATCRTESIKSETRTKQIKYEPTPERKLDTIVVPRECNIPSRQSSSYKWVLLALAGAIILGVVLKKHLAR